MLPYHQVGVYVYTIKPYSYMEPWGFALGRCALVPTSGGWRSGVVLGIDTLRGASTNMGTVGFYIS